MLSVTWARVAGLTLFNSLVVSVVAALIILLLYLVVNELVRFRSRNPSFGGPPGLPIVGNIPSTRVNAPEQFRYWARTYGDVYQIQLGNIPILVVNSAAAAKELLGHHSHALSSRPTFYTFHKIVAATAGATIGTSPISDSLKRRRRAAASALNKPAVNSYVSHLDIETAALIRDFLDGGAAGTTAIKPMPLIQRCALSIVMTVNWGIRMASHDDKLFAEIVEVEAGIVSTRNATVNLQDYIPLLRLNPLSTRSQKAREWRQRRDVYLARLDRDLETKISKRTHQPCIQANAMLDVEAKLSKAELTSISVSMVQGGTATVAGTVNWSLAFLAQHPEIQAKALEDIRRHHGENIALCDAADDHMCTYIAALVRECLRYWTVLRLSLPRATVQDVTYQGRLIPSGSIIFLNAWACNRDPEIWEDPDDFRPERWIERPEAPLFTYGLGYRMCAGSMLANRELYLLFLRVISCFEIAPATKVDVDALTGSAHISEGGRSPKPYKVFFRPRHESLLREALDKKRVELGM